MFEQMTQRLDSLSSSLVLRAQRQQILASNIANADTPGYVARDFDFAAALQGAQSGIRNGSVLTTSDTRHLSAEGAGAGGPANMAYAVQVQPSVDGNSVDMDRERANFIDNAIRYESTLRFINGHVKTMLSAITGQ